MKGRRGYALLAIAISVSCLAYYHRTPSHAHYRLHTHDGIVEVNLTPEDVQTLIKANVSFGTNNNGATSESYQYDSIFNDEQSISPRSTGSILYSSPMNTTTSTALPTPWFVVVNNKLYPRGEAPPDPHTLPVLKLSNAKALFQANFTRFDAQTRVFMEKQRQVMFQRAKTVKKVCRSIEAHRVKEGKQFVWDTKNNPPVLWCPNYKVASTSWMVNYLRLADFNADNPDLMKLPEHIREQKRFTPKFGARQNEVFKLYPKPSPQKEAESFYRRAIKVMVVRHPFTRLLSAYRDKMTKMDPKPRQFKFRQLQLSIIKKYRSKESKDTSPFPSFPEFIQHVIDSTEDLHTAEQWKAEVKCWVPYWVQCDVCSTDYTVIAKLETMRDDERFFFNLANYTKLVELAEPEWRHLNNVSSNQLAASQYSQLSQDTLDQLRDRYQLDFDLFGYEIDDIFTSR